MWISKDTETSLKKLVLENNTLRTKETKESNSSMSRSFFFVIGLASAQIYISLCLHHISLSNLIKLCCFKIFTNHTVFEVLVYAFTSEYSKEQLSLIKYLGAIPVTYKLNRGGINPLIDIKATYELSKKIKEGCVLKIQPLIY